MFAAVGGRSLAGRVFNTFRMGVFRPVFKWFALVTGAETCINIGHIGEKIGTEGINNLTWSQSFLFSIYNLQIFQFIYRLANNISYYTTFSIHWVFYAMMFTLFLFVLFLFRSIIKRMLILEVSEDSKADMEVLEGLVKQQEMKEKDIKYRELLGESEVLDWCEENGLSIEESRQFLELLDRVKLLKEERNEKLVEYENKK